MTHTPWPVSASKIPARISLKLPSSPLVGSSSRSTWGFCSRTLARRPAAALHRTGRKDAGSAGRLSGRGCKSGPYGPGSPGSCHWAGSATDPLPDCASQRGFEDPGGEGPRACQTERPCPGRAAVRRTAGKGRCSYPRHCRPGCTAVPRRKPPDLDPPEDVGASGLIAEPDVLGHHPRSFALRLGQGLGGPVGAGAPRPIAPETAAHCWASAGRERAGETAPNLHGRGHGGAHRVPHLPQGGKDRLGGPICQTRPPSRIRSRSAMGITSSSRCSVRMTVVPRSR